MGAPEWIADAKHDLTGMVYDLGPAPNGREHPGLRPAETRRTSSHGHDLAAPKTGRASDLRVMKFPPVRYLVPGFIAEGCTLLAGRPKLGKSWLMLDVGLAVANSRDEEGP